MASLSTLYFMSVLLASAAGIGSTFIGDRVYPIQRGGEIEPPTPEEVAAAALKASQMAEDLAAAQPQPTETSSETVQQPSNPL
jgi:hypothetical protein